MLRTARPLALAFAFFLAGCEQAEPPVVNQGNLADETVIPVGEQNPPSAEVE